MEEQHHDPPRLFAIFRISTLSGVEGTVSKILVWVAVGVQHEHHGWHETNTESAIKLYRLFDMRIIYIGKEIFVKPINLLHTQIASVTLVCCNIFYSKHPKEFLHKIIVDLEKFLKRLTDVKKRWQQLVLLSEPIPHNAYNGLTGWILPSSILEGPTITKLWILHTFQVLLLTSSTATGRTWWKTKTSSFSRSVPISVGRIIHTGRHWVEIRGPGCLTFCLVTSQTGTNFKRNSNVASSYI